MPIISSSRLCCLYDKLQAFWPLNEQSGNRLASFGSGSALTLTDNNTVTYGAGVNGTNAALFTSANSEYFSLADCPSISFGNEDFTITCWVYLGDQSTDRRVIHKGTGLAPNEFSYALRYRQASGNMRFAISDGSSATGLNSTETITGSTWYFIACWHDSVANTINISVNAGTPASASWTTGSFDDSYSLLIGNDTVGTYYDGKIANIGMWRRVLMMKEIEMLYGSGNGFGTL
jgi:hypothetical protein